MKCLTITVDDKTLFSGEVSEVQWHETGSTVTVSGKFGQTPSFLETLQAAAAARQQSVEPAVSNETPGRPALDVVRDSE